MQTSDDKCFLVPLSALFQSNDPFSCSTLPTNHGRLAGIVVCYIVHVSFAQNWNKDRYVIGLHNGIMTALYINLPVNVYKKDPSWLYASMLIKRIEASIFYVNHSLQGFAKLLETYEPEDSWIGSSVSKTTWTACRSVANVSLDLNKAKYTALWRLGRVWKGICLPQPISQFRTRRIPVLQTIVAPFCMNE